MHESMLFFANTTFVWAPHFPPTSHTLLRSVLFPLDLPLLQYIPYNIVNDNIVQRPSWGVGWGGVWPLREISITNIVC